MSNELSITKKPDFITTQSHDELAAFIRPPLAKIIQGSAGRELKEKYSEGDLIETMTGSILATEKEPFLFTPLYFFAEWVTMNPYLLKNELPMIHARSRDPKGKIAQLAQHSGTRQEPIEGKINPATNAPYMRTHTECLNFAIIAHGSDGLKDTPVILSCRRGTWRDGSRLCSLINARKAPMWGCVFKGNMILREHTINDFWAIEFENPEEGAWVLDEDKFAEYSQVAELFRSNEIEVNYDEEEEQESKDF